MPRTARIAPGGLVYHVLNRSVGKMDLFGTDADYQAFERVMIECHQRYPLRVLSYCILFNHWHFVVWPEHDGQVTDFFRWLAHTHAMRWRVSRRSVGQGHVYQGRFKSFPVQSDGHLLGLLRYVERNPLSAGLVPQAQQWRWSSLWSRVHGEPALKALLAPWPVERPSNWTTRVNAALTAKELSRVRLSLDRGQPYGDDAWVRQIVKQLAMEHTIRPEGRPRKAGDSGSERSR